MENENLAALVAARAAAFAAWQAAPEKGRGAKAEKARLGAELAAANRAVAAAKKAAAAPAVPAADVSAAVDAALAARAARAKSAAQEDAVRRAAALWSAAQEWPRCGQEWPATPAEKRAEALMRANLALAQSWGYDPV